MFRKPIAYHQIINISSNFTAISFKNKNINLLFLLEIVKNFNKYFVLKAANRYFDPS
jgi:hypothetical protein